jgi:hypothetical protein
MPMGQEVIEVTPHASHRSATPTNKDLNTQTLPPTEKNYRFPNPNTRQNMYQFNSRTVYPTTFSRNTNDDRRYFSPTGRNYSMQNEQMPRADGTRNSNPRNNTWQPRQSNVNQLAREVPTKPQYGWSV